MSDKRLQFINGHIDALKHLCVDLPAKSLPVNAADGLSNLLKDTFEKSAAPKGKEEYYRAGYDVTVSLASWISTMVVLTSKSEKKKKPSKALETT